MTLCDAYDVEQLKEDDSRIVMHLAPALAPYKAAILPLSKKLEPKAREVTEMLAKHMQVVYDDTGSIGKRYRREDAIGTPYCITIDFDTENDNSVTIRDRDSMEQVRLPISELRNYLEEKLEF